MGNLVRCVMVNKVTYRSTFYGSLKTFLHYYLIYLGVLAYSPEMPEDFRQETEVLFKKYYPIEISAKLTEEEKLPSIIEWYEISHKLIVETGIEKSFLERLVQHSKCFLR